MAKHPFSLYGLALFLFMVMGVNAAPVSFTPLTKTTAVVPTNSAVTVEYTVKNLTTTPQPLFFKGVNGVTSTAGIGLCGKAITLDKQASCRLQVVFMGSLMATKVDGGFSLCPSATSTACYSPPSTFLAHMTKVNPVTVAPIDPNSINISPSQIITVRYNVKNNTAYRLALHWYTDGIVPPAIKQLTDQSGDCAANFALNGQGNCNLRLQITGATFPPGLGPIPITVCDPTNTACYMPIKTKWLQVIAQPGSGGNYTFITEPSFGSAKGGYAVKVTNISPQPLILKDGPIQIEIQTSMGLFSFNTTPDPSNPDYVFSVNLPSLPQPVPVGIYTFNVVQNKILLGTVKFEFK